MVSKSPIRWFDPEKFRDLRKRRELTFAELGRATGISAATFRHWEAGRYTPSQLSLELAMEALDSPVPSVLSIPPGKATLTDLRVIAHIPPMDAAEALGLSISGYTALERGEVPLTAARIQILSRLFAVHPQVVTEAAHSNTGE